MMSVTPCSLTRIDPKVIPHPVRFRLFECIAFIICTSRQFRSNQTDLNSSFGRSWFFNYDTNIGAGRKPLIQQREMFTADLQQQAQGLSDLAVVAVNKALEALDIVISASAEARLKAEAIKGV